MKNLFIILLAFAVFACQPGTGSTDAAAGSTEETVGSTEATSDATDAGAGIAAGTSQTTVTKDGIASPRKLMKGMIGTTMVTLDYGSPSVKGRTIGTEIAPYGKVWRTGANESTSIEFSKEVTIGEGQTLAAGKYGLFTIPGADKWVIIFNENYQQWGDSDYDEAKDVLRVEVAPQTAETASETMEFVVEGNNLIFKWGNVMVPVAISAS